MCHPCQQIYIYFFKDIILVEKIDIYLFNLFVRIYLLLYDCNLMLSDGEYNLLTYLLTYCPSHTLVCSVAPDDSQLPFMISCWWPIQRVSTFFFDSPIYLPLLEQSNWYTPGWLLGSNFALFWHRMLCKFLQDMKVMFCSRFKILS